MLGENGMTISERSIGVNILYGVMVILYVRLEMHVSRPSENILPIRGRRFDNTTRFMVYYVPMNRKDTRALTSPRLKTSEFYALSYKNKWNPNYKKYHADYRTMPKDLLGKSFFKHANMVMKSNPKDYYEEFLGIKYNESKKIVPHGTCRGKKKI